MVIQVTSDLNFATVPILYKKYRRLVQHNDSLVFDLTQVKIVDNTGVALLIALAREAQTVKKKLVFINLQQQVLALVEAVGIQKVLPLAP